MIRQFTQKNIVITNYSKNILEQMGIFISKNILIEGGFIRGFVDDYDSEKYFVVDAKGQEILPGFVDISANLSSKDNVNLAKNGVAVSINMPNPKYSKHHERVLGADIFNCSLLNDAEGGLADIFDDEIIGFSNGFDENLSVKNLLNSLHYLKSANKRWFVFPLDNSLQGQMNDCLMASILGLESSPNLAESLAVSRALALINATKVDAHFTISTKESLKLLLQAKENGIDITISTPLVNLLFSDDSTIEFNTVAKTLPHLRSHGDIEFFVEHFKYLDFLNINHTSLALHDKNTTFSKARFGMENFYYILPIVFAISKKHGLKLGEILRKISIDTSRLTGINFLLNEGDFARIILIDEVMPYNNKVNLHLLQNEPLNGRVWGSIFGENIFLS